MPLTQTQLASALADRAEITRAEAKRVLEEVAAAPVGRYDAPEERRAKAMAAGLQPELASKLR